MLFEPGQILREALVEEFPLQAVGVINAYTAKLAYDIGFKALYLSGAGVANADLGLPDLALTSLDDVLYRVRHISSVTNAPIIVDADTGWGNPLMVRRTFFELEKAGAAAAHIEDQHYIKRCGHRPGKQLVSTDEMCERIRFACSGRIRPSFMVIARTDAFAEEGLSGIIKRARDYQLAGADMLFAEAIPSKEDFDELTQQVSLPVMANMTEFGKTPIMDVNELAEVNISCVIYPLSAFRAMNAAAVAVYQTIRKEGSQKKVVDMMQTRDELYEHLNYKKYEKQIDHYFKNIEKPSEESLNDE